MNYTILMDVDSTEMQFAKSIVAKTTIGICPLILDSPLNTLQIGVTGSRYDPTNDQVITACKLFSEIANEAYGLFAENFSAVLNHGGCTGADAMLANVASAQGIEHFIYPGHSANNPSDTKWVFPKSGYLRSPLASKESDTHFSRNRAIVNSSAVMLACPNYYGMAEKGGTAYTMNYSLKQGVSLYVITPDGNLSIMDIVK